MTRDRADPRAPADLDPEAVLELVRQVVAELHPETGDRLTIDLDSSLDRDLELDSLGRFELMRRVEDHFGTALPEALLAGADTPRDLLRALASASAGAQPTELPETAPAALGRAEAAPDSAATLLEVLDWHVERHPDRRHILFLSGDGEPEEMSYGELARRARRVAAGLLTHGLEPRQAVGLMLPSGLEYFAAFYGTLYAGGIPVPLYPPARPSQIEDHLRRQAKILDTAQVRVLVAFDQVLPLARLVRAQVPTLESVVTPAELESHAEAPALPAVGEQEIAFLQFTSGSTADPKGVILTHANLLANLRAIGKGVSLTPEDVIVSWLPLYHDMGLIGACMGSLYFAIPLILMSPLSFLSRPARWLRAVHQYRGTLSASPNFGYELCLKKISDQEIEGLDLSSWRGTLNGAEPVSPETLRGFTERFVPYGFQAEALMPVYGLAECSLALAFPPEGRGAVVDAVDREALTREGKARPADDDDPAPLRFVGCGFPLVGHEIRIVDPAGGELGEREEGRLQFRGPSATSGYYRNPEATKKLFDGEWLDSGDLAYLAGGEVFITGRAKDMIIRAGRNIYPQEVEEAVGNLDGVRKGCVAVFGSPDPETGTERLVILAETRHKEEDEIEALRRRIQEVTLDLAGTPADDVVLAPPHSVPKTSSGKIRRAAGRELYETGRAGRRGPAWLQVARLALSGARPQLSRSARAARAWLYAGRFWGVVALAALPVAAAVILTPKLRRRRELARGAARQLARLTSIPLRVEGLEHLRAGGPLVVAANHASYLDAFALTASLPPGGSYLAKAELTQSFLAKVLLERLGTLFVERFDPDKGLQDVEKALHTLRSGESLLFFPEGTFDRTPGLRPFRLGAFWVAVQAGVPVVPVALRGTRSMLRGDDWFPRKGSITVSVRPPVAPDGDDLEAAARLRDRVRSEILRFCGEPDLQPASARRPRSASRDR